MRGFTARNTPCQWIGDRLYAVTWPWGSGYRFISIVARAPSLRAYGYWPMALSIVEAENCTWYSKEGLSL